MAMPDIHDFATLFRGNVRAQLNWARLLELGSPVTQIVTADRSMLGGLRTVWYFNSLGDPVDWFTEGAHRKSVYQVIELQAQWPQERLQRIAYFRQRIREAVDPYVVLLPTYRLRDGLLLLDATHRVVAGLLESADIRALIMTVEGPLSSDLLPDLQLS
ncbi:hypothetical protein A5676_08670 [Mycobacterium malmoense]|uniref:hypothetical protein n=1 Tax=Mycobacterium malmoense TaxID=1780 RepID=UPI00080B9A5E|nr:hypothetical protein [Mycobacterium malmoense]OCB30997.1 hypothetical protein A5676_08670 [Mycobacterium malmoense]